MVSITIELTPDWRLIIEEPSSWDMVSAPYYSDFSHYLQHKTIQCLVHTFPYDFEAIYNMHTLLGSALKGDLELHSSIKNDIGLLWEDNYQMNKNPNLVFVKNRWVGKKHLIWVSSDLDYSCSTSWLYVIENQLYFEIDPTYPYLGQRRKKGDDTFYSYKEFIANYKPFIRIPISWHVARRWYHQIDELMKLIKENSTRMWNENE